MTAEIAVMNCEAVALAADSAISMTTEMGPKVYQSANKIFALTEEAPVALMVYDNAKFLGVPWETAAKAYRQERGGRPFATLREHAEDFLDFLRTSQLLFPDDSRERCATRTLERLFSEMRMQVDQQLARRLELQAELTEEEIAEHISAFITQVADYFSDAEAIPEAGSLRALREKLRPTANEARQAAFEELPLSVSDKRRLVTIAVKLFSTTKASPMRTPNRSGIVIAGFGREEIYPSVYRVVVESLVQDFLKTVDCLVTEADAQEMDAVIIPFAQRESVDSFMRGIDPRFADQILEHWQMTLAELAGPLAEAAQLDEEATARIEQEMSRLGSEALEKFGGELEQRQHDQYLPILNAVSMLPKDELGAMAESLVNLTSFKRKVSTEAETVGGPIDVAVISRGDGLIWIKRKHYFDPKLNPQYFAKRYGRKAPGGQEA